MVRASVVLITKRAYPKVDIALRFLSKQTCLDFEYILVDGYYFQRKQEMEKLITDINPPFPVLYLPDKPSRWRQKRPCLSNARNTALIWAKGSQIIFFDDCCVNMVNDLVEKHLKWGEKGYAVAGAWYTHPDPPYGWESRQTMVKEPQVVIGGWLYGGHMSFPLEAVLKVNGFDEWYDGEQGCDDVDCGIRLSRAGCQVIYDPSLYVEYDLATHSLTQWSPDPSKADWKHEGKPIEPKKRVLKDGREHFSNEWLTQKLDEEPWRFTPLGNKFNLRELRDLPQKHGFDVMKVHKALEAFIDPDLHDWRDGEDLGKIQ